MASYVGTSGFQYKEWSGSFYPKDLIKRKWLSYYAEDFNSVEINSTFYRLPTREAMERWREETPNGFSFAIKGSQYVTHRKRLIDPDEPIERLFDRTQALGPKLAVVLWQFPENFAANQDRLEAFCRKLKAHPRASRTRHAFEFRHLSWFTDPVYRLLRENDYALVISQSSVWPVREVKTATWMYYRFHGPRQLYASGYSEAELEDWAKRIRKASPTDVFAYFNNDNGAFAPVSAAMLRDKLSPRP